MKQTFFWLVGQAAILRITVSAFVIQWLSDLLYYPCLRGVSKVTLICFYFCVNLILTSSIDAIYLTQFTWRDLVDVNMIIWNHLLSRQPYSRQPVTQKRSLFKTSTSLSGNGLTQKGWRDNRWNQIIIFTSTKSRQVNRVKGWCQNHVYVKADESNQKVKNFFDTAK